MDHTKPPVPVGNRVSMLLVTVPDRYGEDDGGAYEKDFAAALGPELLAAVAQDAYDTPHDEECEHYFDWKSDYLASAQHRCQHIDNEPGHAACVELSRFTAQLRAGEQYHAAFFLLSEEELRAMLEARTFALTALYGVKGARYIPPARWIGAECALFGLDEYLEYARLRVMLGESIPSARENGMPLDDHAQAKYIEFFLDQLDEAGVSFIVDYAHLRALGYMRDLEFVDECAEPLPAVPAAPHVVKSTLSAVQ